MYTITAAQEQILLREAKAGSTRYQGWGTNKDEVTKIFAGASSANDWYRECNVLARGHEEHGDGVVAEERRMVSYLTAAAFYHMGELLMLPDNEEKKAAFNSFESVYQKAAAFFPFPAEPVEVPFDGGTLPGYYRRVQGIPKAPSVILVRGVDACREVELHIISNHFLKHGLFTLSVDLPGQGKARMRGRKMTPDFEKPVAAVVDYLAGKPEIDGRRIGILGMSFGGFIAPRAACLEKRLKACVSLGGFFGLDEFEFPLGAKLNCFNNMRFSTEEEWQRGRKDYSLESCIGKLTWPLLVVNGSDDKVIPASQSVKMHDRAPGPKALRIFEGLGHCVYYERPQVLTEIALWMKEQLAA